MMRIWVKVMKGDKILKDTIYQNYGEVTFDTFFTHLSAICHELDIPTPVLLKTHVQNFNEFHNMRFLPRDFVESIDFDKFVLEDALM